MNVWTIYLKTWHQNGTYCVDNKKKIIPYIEKCMKKDKHELDKDYEIVWLASDSAIIYEKGKKLRVKDRIEYGQIHRHFVN